MHPISLTIPSYTSYQAMPRVKYYSDSDEQQPTSTTSRTRLGHQRPLHELLGGGRVADIFLWRNKHLSAAVLAGATSIWFLFEVVEYHFVALLCHLSMMAMLVVFIWSKVAYLFNWSPPEIAQVSLSQHDTKEVALAFHGKLNHFISILHDIACGKDPKQFLMAMAFLLILSVVGSYCSFVSLLYLCFLCIQILPAFYERYENEVNHIATKGSGDLRKLYMMLDSKVLRKIPRGPVKEKKFQ